MGFEKEENGKYKRIWLEQKVVSMSDVTNLQREILKINSEFYVYPEERLHLTIFHFGYPDNLYKEFSAVNEKISFEKFLESFGDYISSLDDLLISDTVYPVKGLDLLGSKKNPKVAMILERNKTIESIRNRILIGLLEIMVDFGINNPENFISKSDNLRYSSNKFYTPHITLGSIENNGREFKVDNLPKKIVTGPSVVANFRF